MEKKRHPICIGRNFYHETYIYSIYSLWQQICSKSYYSDFDFFSMMMKNALCILRYISNIWFLFYSYIDMYFPIILHKNVSLHNKIWTLSLSSHSILLFLWMPYLRYLLRTTLISRDFLIETAAPVKKLRMRRNKYLK